MSNEELIIPKTIHVGFQKREGTYTGKLAYVIYTDAKGVKRKQKSWDGWRDKKIKDQDLENVPTSGFVLNKKVGDYNSRWGGRGAWIRIYDPRDFEFEISPENLLFILQECSAIKGKGLEGEFVYSWDGTELVLLPVSSQDYKLSAEFTELQGKKVTAADMVEGCIYQTKDKHKVMYLGRHDWNTLTDCYVNTKTGKESKHPEYEETGETSSYYPYRTSKCISTRKTYFKTEKRHVFATVGTKKLRFWPQTGFTKIAVKVSDATPDYADVFEQFKKSIYGSPIVEIVKKPFKLRKHRYYGDREEGHGFVEKDGKFYEIRVDENYNATEKSKKKYSIVKFKTHITLKDNTVVWDLERENDSSERDVSKETIEGMSLVELHFKTKSGKTFAVTRSEYDLRDGTDITAEDPEPEYAYD